MQIRDKQTGAALIVALIMLVILTMLGLTTMNSSVIEERMAGNARNVQLSFEAAEAALRVAEQSIGCDACPAHSTATPKDGYTIPGLYEPEDNANDHDWWEKGDWWNPDHAETPNTNWQPAGLDIDGVAAQPEFIVEYLGGFQSEFNCVANCTRRIYRVTARGWGSNVDAVAVIQSIYTDWK